MVLATVPPGPASVVITNAGAVTMFVGAGHPAGDRDGQRRPGPGVRGGAPGAVLVVISDEALGDTSGGTVTAGVFISTGATRRDRVT